MSIYSDKKVQIIVNGTYLTGFRDGDIYSYSEPNDRYTAYVGAGGGVDYSERSDNQAQITVGLKITSPSVEYLNELHESREEIDMTIKDTNDSGMNFSGTDGVIMKRPDTSRGKEIGEVEFTFDFPDHKIQY